MTTKLLFDEAAIKAAVSKSVKVEGSTVKDVKIVTKSVPSGDRGEYSVTQVSCEVTYEIQ